MGCGSSAPPDKYVLEVLDSAPRSPTSPKHKSSKSSSATATGAGAGKGRRSTGDGRPGGSTRGKSKRHVLPEGAEEGEKGALGRGSSARRLPAKEGSSRAVLKRGPSAPGRLGKEPSSRGALSRQASKMASGGDGNQYSWIGRNADGLNPQTMSLKCFDVEERPIGKGGCGFVQIAKLKHSQKHFALKVIPKARVVEHDDVRHLQNEKDLLIMLDHTFIVNLFGSFQDPYYIFLCMEPVVGGELFTTLHQSRKFSDDKAKFYCAEVFVAVEHLHSQQVAWRDLKPENVLLDETGHIKIADFGFATEVVEGERLYSKLGTPHYLAPELLNTKASGGYTKVVDWWAFGCFIYELLTGKSPFGTASDTSYAVYLRVMKGKYRVPSFMQPPAKKLIKMLLTHDLQKRLCTPEAIKETEWFAGMDWQAVAERRLKPPHVPQILFPGDTRNFDRYSKRALPKKNSLSNEHLFRGF